MNKILLNKKAERVQIRDTRYYTADHDKFFPSVTTVLKMWSPEPHLIEWFKNNGRNSDILVREAGERGTIVHNAIEDLVKGVKLNYEDINRLDCWEMIVKFSQFMEAYKPTVQAIEVQMVDTGLGVGGTLDMICTIDGVVWLIDFKTSNYLSDVMNIQLAVYKEMWQNASGMKVDETGILHLNAKTRGVVYKSRKVEGKTVKEVDRSKMQGKGWQVVQPKLSHTELMKDWDNLKSIYDRRHPTPKPADREFPMYIELNKDSILS